MNDSPVRLTIHVQHVCLLAHMDCGTHWQVLRNPLTISDIRSNLCRLRPCALYSLSRSSKSDSSLSNAEPDLDITRKVSASNATTSTAWQTSRRNVRWAVMRLILGMRVCMTDDQAYIQHDQLSSSNVIQTSSWTRLVERLVPYTRRKTSQSALSPLALTPLSLSILYADISPYPLINLGDFISALSIFLPPGIFLVDQIHLVDQYPHSCIWTILP